MATTDPILARRVLELLGDGTPRAALLHTSLPSKEAPMGDLDLVWSEPVTARIIRRLAREVFLPLGLRPVVVCPYDYDAAAIFAVSQNAVDGVHLDLVHDANGRGRLGVRYARLLSRAARRPDGINHVDELDYLVYLLRKRHWKGQLPELQTLLGEARGSATKVRERAEEVLTVAALRDVEHLLVETAAIPRFSRSLENYRMTALRLARRLRSPIGSWYHLDGDDGTVADALARRFGRTLVHSVAIRLEGSLKHDAAAWSRVIAPTRWRPGIALSYGPRPVSPQPDAVVRADRPLDDVAAEVVDQLNSRESLLAALA
jgi:hypothetical protein